MGGGVFWVRKGVMRRRVPSVTATEAVSWGTGRRAAKVSHVNVRCWIESAKSCLVGEKKSLFLRRRTLADDIERQGVFGVPFEPSKPGFLRVVGVEFLLEIVMVVFHGPQLHYVFCPGQWVFSFFFWPSATYGHPSPFARSKRPILLNQNSMPVP